MSDTSTRVHEFGPFRLDAAERILLRHGHPVPLTEKLFELLLVFVENRGRMLTKVRLMQHLWPDTVVEENNLTVNVSLLRKALGEAAPGRQYIETVPRRGYRFVGGDVAVHPSREPKRPSPTQPSATDGEGRVFVARERELARLGELLLRARAGSGRLVFVTGAPGMGKSELCQEVIARLPPEQPWLVAVGQCFEHYGAAEAYSVFLDAIGSLLNGEERERVSAVLQRYAPTWCSKFAALRATGTSDGLREASRDSDAAWMGREMADALEAISAIRPLLLVLEDLHWADPSSVDLLAAVVRRVPAFPALIVATCRAEQAELENHPVRNLRRELVARGQCDELSLPLLNSTSIEAYLNARFVPHEFPEELSELITRRTEGQPLFATRLVQALVERGDIRFEEARFRLLRPVAELELGVPATIRGLIQRKLESLEEQDLRALQYGSVLGVEFTSSAVGALLECDEVLVEERLDRLARLHRLVEMVGEQILPGGATTVRYRFAHALYQNVLYESLASKRRSSLHARVAERLLAEHEAGGERVPSLLAFHFELAKDFPRAVESLTLAGEQASRLYADREAERYYARALSLVPSLEPGARVAHYIILLYNHGWCAAKIGQFAVALRDFRAMLQRAREPEFTSDTPSAARARALVFDFFESPWSDASGVSDAPRMANQDRSFGASAIQCEAYWGICYTLLESDQLDEMAAAIQECLRLAEASGNEVRRAEALAWMASRERKLLNHEAMIAVADESIRLSRAHAHPRSLCIALFTRASAHARVCEYEQAESLLAERGELTIEAQGRFVGVLELSRTKLQLGKVSAALALLEEARSIAERKENGEWECAAATVRGDVFREIGAFDSAVAEYTRAAALARAAGVRPAERRACLRLGWAHARAGRLELAEAVFVSAGALGESATEENGQEAARELNFTAAPALATYHLVRGNLSAARARAEQLLEAAERAQSLAHASLAAELLAAIALGEGDPAAASRHAASGLAGLGARFAPFRRFALLRIAGLAAIRAGSTREGLSALEAARETWARVAVEIADPSLASGTLGAVLARELDALTAANRRLALEKSD